MELNTHLPHPARVYDYMLGGKDNFQADRDLAAKLAEESPGLPISAHENRAFMVRAARHLAAELGIRQFLDVGTGLPTSPNLHEAVQGIAPESRVVYVDNDPIVLVHARALLTSDPRGRTAYLDADLRDPAAIMGSAQFTDTLDLAEPVAVSLIAILHFIVDDAEAHRIVDELMGPLAPGSTLALSIFTSGGGPGGVNRAVSLATDGGLPSLKVRSRTEAEEFFAGRDLVDPGVVLVHRWRPDDADHAVDDADVHMFGGLAVKP